jgi:predicted nucleic-acid-binding Zn-ribbon protein
MPEIEERLGQAFVCSKCRQHGANVEKLAMSGTGFSRFFDIQPYRYAFVSCTRCGYTETYNLKTLEGNDDVGHILDILFSG